MKETNIKKTKTEIVEFDLNALFGLSILIGITALGAAYLLQSMSDVRTDMTTDSIEYNATSDGMEGVAKIPAKLPLIVGIVLIVIIIGLFKRFGDAV